MVKKSRPAQTHAKSPGDKNIKLPKIGAGGDILGQRHKIIKHVDNNVVYGAGALLLLGGGYFAFTQGWLNNVPFISSFLTPTATAPTNVMVNPNAVPQGSTAAAVGSFNPPAPNTYYAVFNSAGTSVLNGTLGTNVSAFNTPLQTQSLPTGSYTIVVSDSPITGPPPGAATGQTAGQVLGTNQQLVDNFTPTSFTRNMNASPGAGSSQGDTITLS